METGKSEGEVTGIEQRTEEGRRLEKRGSDHLLEEPHSWL